MANKRNLKKRILYVCGDLAGECILSSEYIPGIDIEKMYNIIPEIASLQVDTLKRVSFSYDKTVKDFGSKKEYNKAKRTYFANAYKKLNSDFLETVKKIVKKMNEAIPQAQKDANKKS